MILFLKKNFDAYRYIKMLIVSLNFLKFNSIYGVIKLYLIKTFLISNFSRNYISEKKIYHKTIKYKESARLDFKPKDVFFDLKKKGISKVFKLNKEILKNIDDEIFTLKINILKKNRIYQKFNENFFKRKKSENNKVYFKRLEKNKIDRVYGSVDLRNQGYIKNFICNPKILDIASNYLQSDFLSINCSTIVSIPRKLSKSEKIANAQAFHFDSDFSSFLKLYIYLTDVDDHSGPHIYIRGTHLKKDKNHLLHRPYFDKEIVKNYSDFFKVQGKKGSFFFEDAYGLHKGEPPTKKPRILLNIHYGNNKIKYSPNDLFINLKKN